ncbi:MAG: ABC transporter permease [Anaerolineae bacterium]
MTTSPTMTNARGEAKTWRDSIRITRTGIFAVLFIIIGLWVLISVPRNIPGDATTLLTIDSAGTMGVSVPTVGFAVIAAFLYIGGGLVALLPGTVAGLIGQRRGDSIIRLGFWWLVLNGILVIPLVLIIIAAGGKTNITVMLQESLRLSTPVMIGAMAGIWAERSGVTNIAIEGMMLSGACLGFVTYTIVAAGGMDIGYAQALGVVAAVISGGLMAALHAWLSISFKTNQIVSGTVVNILAIGLTSYLRREVLVSSEAARSTLSSLPFLSQFGLSKIPIVGDVFLSGKPIFYAMILLVIATHIIMYYTRWGLRTRAVGENPHAADTLGINVIRNRWINVIISGMIAGMAGAWFTLETTGAFDDNMTAGKGFIALAAMIFGNWTPFGAAAGGLLFGFSEALGQRFQFLGVPIPPQFLQMVPYLVTIIVLAGLIGKATPPKADGVPYEKE